MSYTDVVLTILVAYKLLLLGVGWWASRRTHSQQDFILAGRGLGPVVAALSYSASSCSAWTLLGFSGICYVLGLSAVWIAVGSVSGAIFAWVWIGPRLRRQSAEKNVLTMSEFIVHGLESSWRSASLWLASLIILACFAFYVAAQFQGAGNSFASAFDIGSTQAIVLGATIVMLYTFMGGFWAVSVTDAIQGGLMLVVAIVLPAVAWHTVGGWAGLSAALPAEQLSLSGGNAGLMLLGHIIGSVAVGLGTFGQPHLLNRFMALRDDKALRQARALTIFWYFAVFGGMVVLGICSHVLFPLVDNSEGVFFLASEQLLPDLLAAIVLAAVLSAIMSTADSQLLVAASTISHDLKFGGNNALLVSRCSIAGLTLAAVLLAVYLPESIFSRVLFAWSALGAAFGPLVIAKLADRRVSGAAAFCSMLAGFVSAVAFYLLPNTIGDIAERLIPFLISGTIILASKEAPRGQTA